MYFRNSKKKIIIRGWERGESLQSINDNKRRIDLIDLLIFTIPFLFQVCYVFDVTVNVVYSVYIIILLLHIIRRQRLTINHSYKIIGIAVFGVYFLIPIISFNVNWYTFSYVGLLLLFYFIISILGERIRDNFLVTIKGMLAGNTLLLAYQILINISEINSNSLLLVFNGERDGRAYFGYSHPNSAAMFMVIEMIFIYLLVRKGKVKKLHKFILTVVGLCFTVPLLATGSRTAFYALIIFTIVESFYFIIKRFKKYKFFISVSTGLALFLLFFEKILKFYNENASGRSDNTLKNINILIDRDSVFFGLGSSRISDLTNTLGVTIVDNWYMYIFICYGFCGLGFMLFNLFHYFKKQIKYNIQSKDSYSISLIITLLFYSYAENVMFVPGVLLSLVFWGLIYSESSTLKIIILKGGL